jgi:hypothetical protein
MPPPIDAAVHWAPGILRGVQPASNKTGAEHGPQLAFGLT